MPLTLSKKVPSRRKTITALWCRKDFMKMCDRYRQIRAKARNKMDTCYWCRHKFENGEMMALACIEGTGNRTFCQDCADMLLASDTSA